MKKILLGLSIMSFALAAQSEAFAFKKKAALEKKEIWQSSELKDKALKTKNDTFIKHMKASTPIFKKICDALASCDSTLDKALSASDKFPNSAESLAGSAAILSVISAFKGMLQPCQHVFEKMTEAISKNNTAFLEEAVDGSEAMRTGHAVATGQIAVLVDCFKKIEDGKKLANAEQIQKSLMTLSKTLNGTGGRDVGLITQARNLLEFLENSADEENNQELKDQLLVIAENFKLYLKTLQELKKVVDACAKAASTGNYSQILTLDSARRLNRKKSTRRHQYTEEDDEVEDEDDDLNDSTRAPDKTRHRRQDNAAQNKSHQAKSRSEHSMAYAATTRKSKSARHSMKDSYEDTED